MPELTIIVPTRGRPDNLAALWEAFVATTTANTDLIAWVDNDDPELPGYRAAHKAAYDSGSAKEGDPKFFLITGARRRLGPTLDAAGVLSVLGEQACEAVGFMGDDHRPRTVGWDAAYLTELRRLGTGIVYGDDLIQGPNLPTQVAMTSDIVLATGHMVPPGIVHMYIDNAWKVLGEALGALSYLPQVVIEHCHPIAGTAAWDAGYREVNDASVYDHDRAVFEQWQKDDLPRWVQQIRSFPRD